MKKSTPSLIVCPSALAALSACGGDAGDTTPGQTSSFTASISANNQNNVARSSVVGSQGIAQAQSSSSSRVSVMSVLSRVQAQVANTLAHRASVASADRAHPADSFPGSATCTLGGHVDTNYNDPDNNGVSAGDTMSVHFVDCQTDATSSLDGTVTITFTGTSQYAGTAAYQQFTAIENGLTTTIDGAYSFTEDVTPSQTATDVVVGTSGLSVKASDTASGYSDTIAFANGTHFAQTAVLQTTIASTIDGTFSSTSIGGSVTVKTVQPLLTNTDDPFPHAGELSFTGAHNSTLVLTVIDTSSVQLQLDADGNGASVTTTTVDWTSLFPS